MARRDFEFVEGHRVEVDVPVLPGERRSSEYDYEHYDVDDNQVAVYVNHCSGDDKHDNHVESAVGYDDYNEGSQGNDNDNNNVHDRRAGFDNDYDHIYATSHNYDGAAHGRDAPRN